MPIVKRSKTLRELISSPSSLERAWRSVRAGSKPTSHGLDSIQIQEFKDFWPDQKPKLQTQLKSGTFKFGRYLGVAIEKVKNADIYDLNSWRPISVPNVIDRIVQRAILDKIWTRIRDEVCNDSSFGGIRPYKVRGRKSFLQDDDVKKSVEGAAKRIFDLKNSGYEWVFETDIKNFFPSINKDKLLSKVFGLLRDDSINDLIVSTIDTSVVINNEKFEPLTELWKPLIGVPQGGVLSPTFANLYLSDFDRTIKSKGFQMVRYVDDLIILCKSKTEALAAYKVCLESLADLDLSIHALDKEENGKIKTTVKAPGESFNFLGLTFSKYSILPKESKFKEFEEKIQKITWFRRDSYLPEIVKRINLCIKGWTNAYSFCNLHPNMLEQRIDNFVAESVREWLWRAQIIRKKSHLSNEAYKHLGIDTAKEFRATPLMPWSVKTQEEQILKSSAKK